MDSWVLFLAGDLGSHSLDLAHAYKTYLFHLYVRTPVYVCASGMCLVLRGQKRALDSPGAGVTGCESHKGPENQSARATVFLIPEPLLRPLNQDAPQDCHGSSLAEAPSAQEPCTFIGSSVAMNTYEAFS